jgi:SAM-dependent methyltransferase
VSLEDPELLEREYSTTERLERRRHNVTGWVRGEDPWVEALAAVAETRPRRVLDAGCGDGVFARAVAAPVVVGVDMAASMVELARRRGVDARRGRIENLPFADGEFDIVVCNWVLYHLPDADAGVRELARVLRPGGRFVGIYNRDRHMAELWDRLHPASAEGDDYHDVLARHFVRVETRDTEAHTLWQTREDLQAFLDASVELLGRLEAPAAPYPFTLTRRNRVYVAEKAS